MDRFGKCHHSLNSLDEIGRGMCDECCERCKTKEDRAFDEIEKRQEASGVHPLLNPDSPHYHMVDGVEAISRMEDMYPPHELMVWAKITAMKYRLRIGNKDDALKEVKKLQGYEAYYKYLEAKCLS